MTATRLATKAEGGVAAAVEAARRLAVPGAGARAMLIAAAIGGGAALALALLPTILAYGGH